MLDKLELIIDPDKTWVVSDTHFHHFKLCKNCPEHFDNCRKYYTIKEMDDDIVNRWNEFIRRDDLVIFCGDFLMNTRASESYNEFWRLLNMLNGDNIIFIKGNHDHIIEKKVKEIKFVDYVIAECEHKKKLFIQHKDFDENSYFLNNEIKEGLNKDDCILIHGHTHSTIAWRSSVIFQQQMYNVCWDVDYRPFKVSEFFNQPFAQGIQ